MKEETIEIAFKHFLKEDKDFPSDSMLVENMFRHGNGMVNPDLILIDHINNEYIGIVEFKNDINAHEARLIVSRLKAYCRQLEEKDIPAYLVTFSNDQDFEIYELSEDGTFKSISKNNFPRYHTLVSQKLTKKKIEQRNIETKKLNALNQKRQQQKKIAYLSILSIIIGVSVSILAVLIQQKGYITLNNSKSNMSEFNSQAESLQQQLDKFENRLNLISHIKKKTDTIIIDKDLSQLEKRIRIIENGISDNPERTLSILELRQQVELLKNSDVYNKELIFSEINALKGEIKTQNAWILGVLITILGTILSFAITNLISKKN